MSRPQARRAQELADQAGLTEAHFKALLSVGVSDTGRGAATQSGTGKNTARHGITVDMSADYCRLADWRTNDRNQLAKVLGVAKADAPAPEQMDLFGEATA